MASMKFMEYGMPLINKSYLVRTLTLFPFLFAIGCFPSSKNNLPTYCLYDDERLVGKYWSDGYDSETKKNVKVISKIEKEIGKKGMYLVKQNVGQKESGKLNLFKIGGVFYTSIHDKKEERFAFFKVKISRNSIDFTSLRNEWFENNPKALPGTEVKDGSVNLKASSDQLYQFLLLHLNTDDLYDSKPILTLNRIGT